MQRDEVIATIDAERFEAIRARWSGVDTGHERRHKYLDLWLWIGKNLRRAQALGLDSGPRRRVLDLGCGCGYFLYVCKLLGHEVLGVDRAERSSVYVEMRELLGVPWVGHTIRPGDPPQVGDGWGVATAHMVTFNGHCTDAVWGATEWAELLAAVPAPVWYLELNREPDGTVYTPGLREFFESQGARVSRHRVLIDRRG